MKAFAAVAVVMLASAAGSSPVIPDNSVVVVKAQTQDVKAARLLALRTDMAKLALAFGAEGHPTVVKSIYLSNTTKPSALAVVVFQQDPQEFALMFIWEKGSWTVFPEDFLAVPTVATKEQK